MPFRRFALVQTKVRAHVGQVKNLSYRFKLPRETGHERLGPRIRPEASFCTPGRVFRLGQLPVTGVLLVMPGQSVGHQLLVDAFAIDENRAQRATVNILTGHMHCHLPGKHVL